MSKEKEQRRVHILGTGSIGKFLAHSIRSAPNSPPISLLYHRPIYLRGLQGTQCSLTVGEDDDPRQSGPFDVELVLPQRSVQPENSPKANLPVDREALMAEYADFVKDTPISHLIVTVKSWQLKSAMESVKHRLRPQSTVMLCMNGMGHMEELLNNVWPDSEKDSRPNFMQCVNSHGVLGTGPYSAIHTGHGVMYLAVVPPSQTRRTPQHFDPSTPVPESSLHLMRTITRVPVLAAVTVSPPSLHERALEKLAVNCVINPLTALMDCRNGRILSSFDLKRSMRMLLAEISLVFRSLPEFEGAPNVDLTFSPERLEKAVERVATLTKNNMSSMLQDIRKGSRTEIQSLNGYVVRRGEEMGIKPVMNYLILKLILGKSTIVRRENQRITYQDNLSNPGLNANPKL